MYTDLGSMMGVTSDFASSVLIVLGIWEIFWKGIGMWYSAGKKQTAWFVCILIFNTVGILPIVYLLMHKPWEDKKRVVKTVKKKVKK